MIPFLTGNALKIIAAVAMFLDHAGLMLFPTMPVFRIVGRLAFPIFAYMIAEGCKYTKNRRQYFLTVFLLALVCQIVYFFVDGSLYLSILFTFSLSILMIYALQSWKENPGLPAALVFLGAVTGAYLLNQIFEIDYGFCGCMVPVLTAVFHRTRHDTIPVSVAMLGLGLLLLSADLGGVQYYSLLVLPLLLCYNGKRGKHKMKYFFYIFYPAHLVLLQGIAMLLG